jgi:hypothetical protein
MTLTRRKALVLTAPTLVVVAAACQSAPSASNKPAATTAKATTDKLLIAADVVQGSKNVPKDQAALKSCVLSSRFPRNSEMVWRVRVYDPSTAELMDDKALNSVQVKLANGTSVDLKYGPHPKDPPNEYYWASSWVVPKDHPTGTLRYSIVGTAADGRIGQFEPIAVAPSLPSIVDEVLADTTG